VARRATQVHQAAFGEHEDGVAVGEGVHVHLRLDVGFLDVLRIIQRIDLDLIIEVADVADDGLVLLPRGSANQYKISSGRVR
jgi:hypothetical protein